jgi:Na+-transporting NADH:ubiquinone oxidoreductase subunit C
MVEKKWYPIFYMFIVTAVFSSFVIGFTQTTLNKVKANEKLIFEKAVLAVFPELYDTVKNSSGIETHNAFVKNIKEPGEQTGGAYVYNLNDQIKGYAIPVEGKGFWAEIKAIIGVDADRKTITGFAVYQQNETPGLGAEISKPEFRKQFENKVLSKDAQFISIKRPGSPLNESSVHAITGATQTSVRLEVIINEGLKKWQESMPKETK